MLKGAMIDSSVVIDTRDIKTERDLKKYGPNI